MVPAFAVEPSEAVIFGDDGKVNWTTDAFWRECHVTLKAGHRYEILSKVSHVLQVIIPKGFEPQASFCSTKILSKSLELSNEIFVFYSLKDYL